MKRLLHLVFMLSTVVLTASQATAQQLVTLATWNIEHLRAGINVGANPRTQADFDRLAGYATQLNADIVVLQEVDGEDAAARVFDPTQYNFFFSSRNATQRTGFAVRKTLSVQQHPDVTTRNVTGGLRHGTDITVTIGDTPLRLLAVHLKSGCFQKELPVVAGHLGPACEKLAAEVKPLEDWIDARAAAATPFAVLGDFNRRFGHEDGQRNMLPNLDDAQPVNADLTRVTAGRTSECWHGQFPRYIDHILLGKQVATIVVDGSFQQLLFTEPISLQDTLSDHCAISVQLALTDRGGPDSNTRINAILRRFDALKAALDAVKLLRP